MRYLIFLFALLLSVCSTAVAQTPDSHALPEFTTTDPSAWINGPPLTVAALRGKVVLVDIWTFDCWNCYRSFPWLNSLEKRFSDAPFAVVGIHSPEFDHEHDRQAVMEKTREFELQHPVMLDNDFAFWRALNNRYWPAFYLVDKQGRIRFRHVGETHAGDARAERIEGQIRTLLAEPG